MYLEKHNLQIMKMGWSETGLKHLIFAKKVPNLAWVIQSLLELFYPSYAKIFESLPMVGNLVTTFSANGKMTIWSRVETF